MGEALLKGLLPRTQDESGMTICARQGAHDPCPSAYKAAKKGEIL